MTEGNGRMIVSLEPELLERLSRLDGEASAAAEEEDESLRKAVRLDRKQRKVFYVVVLLLALVGQASGVVEKLGTGWLVAFGAVIALELGGVSFLSNADVRRRLGENATVSRVVAVLVAVSAITFNLVSHWDTNWMLGAFFALMSALGFISWWTDMENRRRDRLRAKNQLAAVTPSYELWGHWLRHPLLTRRARSLARAYPQLGLYGSLEAALIVTRQEKRNEALSAALQKRLKKTVGKDMAEIAILTYDMDQVAERLRAGADYDGLTAILAAELSAVRVGGHVTQREPIRAGRAALDAAEIPALPVGTTDRTDVTADRTDSRTTYAADRTDADEPSSSDGQDNRPVPSWSPAAEPEKVLQSAGSGLDGRGSGLDQGGSDLDRTGSSQFGSGFETTSEPTPSKPDLEALLRAVWTAGANAQSDGKPAAEPDPNQFGKDEDDADDADEDETVEPTASKIQLARAYWDEQIAAGNMPRPKDLKMASGASDSLCSRWVKRWAAEAGLDAPVSGTPINGAHVA
ncbi:hypothetical protein AB0M47_21135 [Hamadaea sp. NPDC051192]|uniref:hypothetical protein n=1 Tax=Hamadaea sp. NPDC051192 TaxID=3154940 RepID=UPI00344AA9B7